MTLTLHESGTPYVNDFGLLSFTDRVNFWQSMYIQSTQLSFWQAEDLLVSNWSILLLLGRRGYRGLRIPHFRTQDHLFNRRRRWPQHHAAILTWPDCRRTPSCRRRWWRRPCTWWRTRTCRWWWGTERFENGIKL
jgi:hypothetical protein